MITKIKNSEISQQNKTIQNLQNGLNSLNNTVNNESNNLNNNNYQYSNLIMDEFNELEKRTKLIGDENLELKNILNDYQKKIEEYENLLLTKEKQIKTLQKKNKEIEEEMNTKNEELIINSEENLSQVKDTQNKVEQLIIERNDLIKQNTDLRYAYEQFNIGVKEANDLFIEKVKVFENIILNYNNKIKELQDKIKKLSDENTRINNEYNKLKKENEKIQKKGISNTEKIILQGNSTNLPNYDNNTILQSPNRLNHLNNNNYPSNNFSNQSTMLKGGKGIQTHSANNVIFNNGNYDINDPYADNQLKAIQEFRMVLNKVDQNLNRYKINLGQE